MYQGQQFLDSAPTTLNQNRQDWYAMANLPFEYDVLAFRTTRPLFVLICVFIACGRDNDIPGWERKPPCLL
jgi:hypothetical protein